MITALVVFSGSTFPLPITGTEHSPDTVLFYPKIKALSEEAVLLFPNTTHPAPCIILEPPIEMLFPLYK